MTGISSPAESNPPNIGVVTVSRLPVFAVVVLSFAMRSFESQE